MSHRRPSNIFEGEPAVKLHAKNIEVGTSANETPDKTKSPWGGFTVLDLLTIKAFRFVRIQYHAPVIAPLLNPSQAPVKGGSYSRSVCWLANNC